MVKKSSWKNLSYAKKGGISLAIIGLLLVFLRSISCNLCDKNNCVFPSYCDLINKITFNFYIDFNGLQSVYINYYLPWISLLATIICYFIIGAIIGFIIGKIKYSKPKK